MYKHTHLLCGLLSLMSTQQTHARITHRFGADWVDAMHSHMRSMQEQMAQSIKHMQDTFDQLTRAFPEPDESQKGPQRSVSLDADDTHVTVSVTVPHADPDAMSAERHLETIVLSIPQEDASTTIRIGQYALSVEHNVERKTHDEPISQQHSYMERSLPYAIDMAGDVAIEHVKEDNMVVVKLPRKHPKKAAQPLPIVKR